VLSLETSLQLRISGRFEPFRAISGEVSSVSAQVTLAAGFRAGAPRCARSKFVWVLLGRAEESAVIDQLLANARSGSSGTIVIKGEAGIGMSALLDYAAHHASGMRVLRISGVESEAEMAFGDGLPELQLTTLLSPRTVGYHLYKAYPKLGVSSRRGLVDLDLRP